MPDNPALPLPSDDPRSELRKMIAMLDHRVHRLEQAGDEPAALADAQELRDKMAALVSDIGLSRDG